MTGYDVLVIGYGPAGMVLSALLGQRGRRVAVIERYAGLYNLPRAATFDDDAMRLLQKLGIAESVAAGTRVQRTYDWCNAEGEVLIGNEFSDFGASGWPEFNMMFQPVLERELDALCRRTPGVEIIRGYLATEFRQTGDGVEVVAQPAGALGRVAGTPPGEPRTFAARFAVGCDGGNSKVRSGLDIKMDDYGFQEPWLVCDFRLKRAVDLPMALQYGDPGQPTSIISLGPHHHRFSFMLDEGVSAEAVDPDEVWRRVSRWITRDDAELIRAAPYTFRSTVAQEWKQGRFLLAGDAAHQMPPFLGQGMCSGFRDAHNLAWKLDLVLRGATKDLLETYAAERSPHVRAITEKAVELGRVQTVRDKQAARLRDEELLRRKRSGRRPEGFRFPGYSEGFLAPASPDDSARGQLFPQAWVGRGSGRVQRFDDVSGAGWVLVVRDPSALAGRDDDLVAWRAAGGTMVMLGAPAEERAEDWATVDDVDGAYQRWFDGHGCASVIVRPDWYVYGSAVSPDSLRNLLRSCLSDLRPVVPEATGQPINLSTA
jgi:2-polyprenyl-6-methoxyphenol hydroxylase-like FAD-dependent oxidoreductase